MGISFKDTILHMFVKDKVEQKPKEELSDEELKKNVRLAFAAL